MSPAALAQRPEDRPNRSKKSPAPLFHAFRRSVRKEMWEAYAPFVAGFRRRPSGSRTGTGPGFPKGVSRLARRSWAYRSRRLRFTPPEDRFSSPLWHDRIGGTPSRRLDCEFRVGLSASVRGPIGRLHHVRAELPMKLPLLVPPALYDSFNIYSALPVLPFAVKVNVVTVWSGMWLVELQPSRERHGLAKHERFSSS